jgi:Flp pilus assembly protein TadD
MRITHKIDDFLYTLFPSIKEGSREKLIEELEKYYVNGPFKPRIEIAKDQIQILIDTPAFPSQEHDFKQAVMLCENRQYEDARSILNRLVQENPANSEYHRILGQIAADEGNQDQAVKHLTDALRWDPENGWALIMMGNVWAKFKNDIHTAKKYYDQALILNPEDNIVINNIGANLMQQGKIKEARQYFEKALKINDKFPNTYYALAMVAEKENDLNGAFKNTILAIRFNENRDGLFKNSVLQAVEFAKKICETEQGKKIVEAYRETLEKEVDKEIEIVEDTEIPTAAKFEMAENYKRARHILRFKPSYPAVEHLVMHELVHLAFAHEARKKNRNQLFISNHKKREKFFKDLKPVIRKLKKKGYTDESVENYCSAVFDGLNRQIFNTPIDLFIENIIYKEYPKLRPYQFLSLYGMLQEGLTAVTDPKIIKHAPKAVISKSKIYNLVPAIQFKALYGIDLVNDFKPAPRELKIANEFYEEYIHNKDNKNPGEEYDLIWRWAMVLKVENHFDLISENEYRSKESKHIPEEYDSETERKMEAFQKSQWDGSPNMDVVMFMVEALQYFEKKPGDEIKTIAMEIAMQGAQGYNPDKEGYKIGSIKDRIFTGYEILAFFYVSWALAMPDMLPQLELPYDEEYGLAKTLYTQNGE